MISRARLSVSARFMLVLAIGFAFQACISVVSLVHLRKALLQARTAEVKHLLETAYSTVVFYHDQSTKGIMTDQAARSAAIDTLRAMHYDGKNYYFIWTMDGAGVSHGSHPEWEGVNVLQSPGKEKLPLVNVMVSRLVAVCLSEQKEGVASYRIPKPGQSQPLDKISYTKLFAPWGWSIGTGVYLDDIDATFWNETLSILWIFITLITIASLITFALGRDLAGALKRLSMRVTRVAKGALDDEIPEVERGDEVGEMARALLVLRDTSREAVELRLDQLTGLPNRKQFMDRLRQAIAVSARSQHYGGLLFVDMDRFKAVNDNYGHDAGDQLLREVAQRLSACVRAGDTVARLGGDEFVVVVIEVGEEEKDAASIVEGIGVSILADLNKTFQLGSFTHSISASVGLTMFKGDGASAEELLKQADLAMYRSKETGRNACHFFDPNMEATVRQRAALEADLQLALVGREFQLFYQPQIGGNGEIEGAEALIRWNHPQRGLILPDEFIPLAEETGLILELGHWALIAACKQLAKWAQQSDMAQLKISVNVSIRQFQHDDFVGLLIAAVEETGADPCKLELELTESLLVKDVDAIIEKMLTLREIGVGFSLDDFGTGYSSLSYLKRMPLDQLKIDQSFVREVLTDSNAAAIAKTVVALAHALGLEVIAEGVETAGQRVFLANSGCDSYQGYFYSRPLPLASFEQFVRQPPAVGPALIDGIALDVNPIPAVG